MHPTINPAFYTTLFDIRTAIHAIRTLISLLATPAWDGFILEPFPAVAALSTDDEIEAYIRTFADSLKHPTSTAKISKTTDTGGVVGPDLLVKGAKGLRIVDASVLVRALCFGFYFLCHALKIDISAIGRGGLPPSGGVHCRRARSGPYQECLVADVSGNADACSI